MKSAGASRGATLPGQLVQNNQFAVGRIEAIEVFLHVFHHSSGGHSSVKKPSILVFALDAILGALAHRRR
jgi:hypothetical protein